MAGSVVESCDAMFRAVGKRLESTSARLINAEVRRAMGRL
jgi:hypothetical protein